MATGTCSIEDCTNPASRKGWCYAHYRRWRAYGNPTDGGPLRTKYGSAADRFWVKVDKSGGPQACWPWIGSRTPDGYGKFSWREIRTSPLIAARVAFYLTNGRWPGETLHECDNPPCVNPAHLRDGTHRENAQEAAERGGKWHAMANGSRKLTTEDVLEIRAALRSGETRRSIAARYNVSASNIGYIQRGQSWTTV